MGETWQPHRGHGRNLSCPGEGQGQAALCSVQGLHTQHRLSGSEIYFSASCPERGQVLQLCSAPSQQRSPPAKRFQRLLRRCLLPALPCLPGVPRSQPPLSKRHNKYSRSIKRTSSARLFALDAKNGPGRLGASSVIDRPRHPLVQRAVNQQPRGSATAAATRRATGPAASEPAALNHRRGTWEDVTSVCFPRLFSLRFAGC